MKIYNLENNSGKNVTFIQMCHVSDLDFHNKVYNTISKLKQFGYYHFFEGVNSNKDDKDLLSTLGIKINNAPPNFGLEDLYSMFADCLGLSHEISFEKSDTARNVDLVTKDLNLNVNFNISIDYNKLLELSRNKILMGWVGFCLKIGVKFSLVFGRFFAKRLFGNLLFKRDSHLAEETYISSFDKIVITYGALHFYGFFNRLKELDSTFRIESEEKI